MTPDLSIIIVNWNTRDLLENCLRSIQRSRGRHFLQTIVVDNNSGDGSREMVSRLFPEVVLLNSGGNLGFARANNVGLPHATASLVLFLNPDTEVTELGLAKMIECMKADWSIGALGCKIRNLSGSIQQLGVQRFPSPMGELLKMLCISERTQPRLGRFFPYHDPEKSGEVKKLFGACLLVRRVVLERVGSFDDRFFMYCEDVDLCQRILKGGWRLYYLSDAEILHLGGSASSKASSYFSVLMTCESLAQLMEKHYGKLGRATYRVSALLGAQARLAMLLCLRMAKTVGFVRRDWAMAGASGKYLTVTKWCLGLQKPVVKT
jgi:GT2 family glycosyltransferase